MTTSVSIDAAKLLQLKGFPQLKQDLYSAPSIAHVLEWLYEEHNIWINVTYSYRHRSWDYSYSNTNWTQEEFDENLKEYIDTLVEQALYKKIKYNSPTEAYEAAILDVLNSVIQ